MRSKLFAKSVAWLKKYVPLVAIVSLAAPFAPAAGPSGGNVAVAQGIPTVTFDFQIDAGHLGPWMFDPYDDTPYIHHVGPPDKGVYAYRNFVWNEDGHGNGNWDTGGSGHQSHGIALAETLPDNLLNGVAGVTMKADGFALALIQKKNWGIFGQSGDHREYTGGVGTIYVGGAPKLTVKDMRISIEVDWPALPAGNPAGPGDSIEGVGWGTIDPDPAKTDPAWKQEFDNGNGQLLFEFSSLTNVIGPNYWGAYLSTVIVKGAPHQENVEVHPVIAPGVLQFPLAKLSLNVSTFTNGGPPPPWQLDQNNFYANRIMKDPGGAPPPGIAQVIPHSYWTLGTVLDAINTSVTFDISGIPNLPAAASLRILKREAAGKPWAIYTDYTLVDATHIRANNVTSFSDFGLGEVPVVPVSIKVPTPVYPNLRFIALVEIGAVSGLDATNFDISFDPTKLTLLNVTAGKVGGVDIPVDFYNQIQAGSNAANPRVVRVVQNITGLGGATGTGYLAALYFKVIGGAGSTTDIGLGTFGDTPAVLGNTLSEPITATWTGATTNVSATAPPSGVFILGVADPPSFLTIQDAINSALATPGSTIVASNGTFAGFKANSKRDLIIQGAGAATVNTGILTQPAAPATEFTVMAGAKDSRNVNIVDLAFDGTTVSGTQLYGIRYYNSTGSVVNVSVSNLSDGDHPIGIGVLGNVDGATDVLIKNSVISNSEGTLSAIGILVENSIATIDNTEIYGSGVDTPDGDKGIILFDNAVADVVNTTIQDWVLSSPGPTAAGIGVMVGFPKTEQEETAKFGHVERASYLQITGSTIKLNNIGILADDTANVVAHNNNIQNNDVFGVAKHDPPAGTTVDATNNWWGNASGPTHSSNPGGTGDAVTNRVNYSPWLDGLYPGGQPTTGNNFTVSGAVKEVGGPAFLAGVNVWLRNTVTGQDFGAPSTGADGVFSIVVPGGQYTFNARKTGYVQYDENLTVSANISNKLIMLATGFTVSGVVKDSATLALLSGATVWLYDESATKSYGGPDTEADGAYSITVPADTDYLLKASKGGYNLYSAALVVDASKPNTLISMQAQPSVGPVNHFMFDSIAAQTAGTPFDITVTAKDSNHNTVTNYAGNVHFTSTDAGGGIVLPTDYTFIVANNGVKTFAGVTLKTAGTQTITATDTGNSAINGTSGNITVNPGQAASLRVTGNAVMAAGANNQLTITAYDTYGNIATGYTGDKSLTFSGPAAAPAGNTPTVTDKTVAATNIGTATTITFTSGVSTSGGVLKAYKAEVTNVDVTDGTINSTGNAAWDLDLTVNHNSANNFEVSGIADPIAAGTASDVTVRARDLYGNTATGYTGTIHFTSSDAVAGVVLPADAAFNPVNNGARTFAGGVTLQTPGEQSVTATDTGTNITGSQTNITVQGETPFHVGLAVTSAIGSANVTFGVDPAATAGFDEAFDYPAPLDPPEGVSAYFSYPLNSPDAMKKLATSYIPPANELSWLLKVKYILEAGGPASGNATITWNAADMAGVPQGYVSVLLRDAADTTTLADMKAVASYTFPVNLLEGESSKMYTFLVKVSKAVSFDLVLKAGWNLASLPVNPGTTDPAVILQNVGWYAIYTWDAVGKRYTRPDAEGMVVGKGYWVLVLNDVTQRITGLPVNQFTFSPTAAGWYLIGSLYSSGAFAADPAGNAWSKVYEWDVVNKRYSSPLTNIVPGMGNWFLALGSCTVTVN